VDLLGMGGVRQEHGHDHQFVVLVRAHDLARTPWTWVCRRTCSTRSGRRRSKRSRPP
jgi:hypothetical protein